MGEVRAGLAEADYCNLGLGNSLQHFFAAASLYSRYREYEKAVPPRLSWGLPSTPAFVISRGDDGVDARTITSGFGGLLRHHRSPWSFGRLRCERS